MSGVLGGWSGAAFASTVFTIAELLLLSRGELLLPPAAGTSRGTVLPLRRVARLHPAPRAAVRGVKREYGDERAKPLIGEKQVQFWSQHSRRAPEELRALFEAGKPEPATIGRRKKRFDPGRWGRG